MAVGNDVHRPASFGITMMLDVDFVKNDKQIQYKSKADQIDKSTNFKIECELSWLSNFCG
jgi:hypothetical protein